MGSDGDQANEKPAHRVRITSDFYLGVYEVKQSEYVALMQKNPSYFKDNNYPVETVSWDDANAFCKSLTLKENEAGILAAGWSYRLTTEAEWEFAARAGSTSKWSHGDSPSQLTDFAWYDTNSAAQTHRVGTKTPNAWGLFDMSGNVWEWCQDSYDSEFYQRFVGQTVDNPVNRVARSRHVIRGGSWYSPDLGCRPSNRGWNVSSSQQERLIGFRVALARTR